MPGDAAWAALAAAAVLWELACRHSRGRLPGAARVGSLVAMRLPGRLLLVALWVFFGFHVFARYGVSGR